MKKHILGGLLTAAILLCASLLHAEDFIFNVPVELHKIPADIKTFAVNIEVYDKEFTSEGYPAAGSTRIGAGSTPNISIVNGEYVGTVTVKFNADQYKKPEKAIVYSGLLVLGNAGGCGNSMRLDGPYPYDPQKPIVCEVYGKLPSPGVKQIQARPVPRAPMQMK